MQAKLKHKALLIFTIIMLLNPLSCNDRIELANTATAQVRAVVFNLIFESVFPKLLDALGRMDQHKYLPKSTWFGEDQRSNAIELRNLLDEIIKILGISDITDYRQGINDLEQNIRVSQGKIAEYQQKKVTAPSDPFLGMHDTPFRVTKKGYQDRIDDQYELIDEHEKQIDDIRSQLANELSKIGLELTNEQLEMLLSSVVGNDIMSMSVVFNNVREITIELEKLTNKSGENVEAARRYYGVYKVLLHVLDYMQNKFINDINRKYIPRIKQYILQAKQNITEAKTAISHRRGDRDILKNNIAANKLTQKTSELYQAYLEEQKIYIQKQNKALADDIITADNTYKTVSLSSNVIKMLRKGLKEFEALAKLKIPKKSGCLKTKK